MQEDSRLQDLWNTSSLVVMFRDEAVNAQFNSDYENHPGFTFWSDVFMAYRNRPLIVAYHDARDTVIYDLTDAVDEFKKQSEPRNFSRTLMISTTSVGMSSSIRATRGIHS